MLDLPRATVCFTIPGNPFGKQRPRFSRKSGRAFTPGATVAFEGSVAGYGHRHFATPFDGPVRLTVTAVFVPAASWSQKKRAAHMGRSHTQTPDLDNVVKGISDGLNRIAYADDAQIAELVCSKVWGERAETIVKVEAI